MRSAASRSQTVGGADGTDAAPLARGRHRARPAAAAERSQSSKSDSAEPDDVQYVQRLETVKTVRSAQPFLATRFAWGIREEEEEGMKF